MPNPLGSLAGRITLTIGNQYMQRASDVVTPQGDITVKTKAIDILAAETSANNSSKAQQNCFGSKMEL